MSERRLLYLDAHGLAAYRWRRGELSAEGSFAPTPEDLERFSAYLKAAGKQLVFRLLSNVGDEDYRVETIPFLKGQDREEYIARKNAQFFPGTPFTATFSLGHEKSSRRNERVLFHALTRPGDLEPWLNCLAGGGAALACICTTAQLGAPLCDVIRKRPPGGLLLTQLGGAIRESYVLDGQTLFSRLVVHSDDSVAALAAALASEAQRLRQYLLGQRQLDGDQLLPTLLLVHPQAVAAVRDACSDIAGLACTVLDSHLLSGRIGLLTPPRDNGSEAIFLHLLAKAPPRRQFAPAPQLHAYRLLQARRALLAGGAAAFLAALPVTVESLYDSHALNVDARRLETDERELGRRHGEILASLPPLPMDQEDLFRITTRYTELLSLQRQPLAAYQLISRSLEGTAAVQLEALEWTPDERGGEEIILRAIYRADSEMRPRQIWEDFENFVRSLQANPGMRVEVLQAPIDIAASTPGSPLENGPLAFALQITRRGSHAP